MAEKIDHLDNEESSQLTEEKLQHLLNISSAPLPADQLIRPIPQNFPPQLTPGDANYQLSVPSAIPEKRHSGLFFLGIIVLTALLTLQYLFYQRTTLSQQTIFRPLLSTLCEVARCNLPLKSDLNLIHVGTIRVENHPRQESALLITAELENRALFSQPYPHIELLMTNILQEVVASRTFTVREYLNVVDPPSSFPNESLMQLQLEIIDPSETAVGFELILHRSPKYLSL